MTEVMEQQDVRFTAAEQKKVARIKELLKVEKQTAWEIGDLVLDLCGPSGTPDGMGRLTALAASLGVSNQLLARYRVTSEVFPPHKRTWDLPHSAYQQLQAYPAIADAVLSQVAEDPRAYSDTRLKDVKDDALRQYEIPKRTPVRLSKPELFTNKIITFGERLRKNQVTLGRSEAQEILDAWREVEPLIRTRARSNQQ